VQLSFELHGDRPLDAEMTVQGFPGLRRATMASTADVRLVRPRPKLADGEDDVCLIINEGSGLSITQRRFRSDAEPGDGVLLVYREAAVLDFRQMGYTAIRVPIAALAPLTRNIPALAGARVPRETPALRLLLAYLASLPATADDPRLNALVAGHAYDLMALAIGATRDAAEQARSSVRAARLAAIRNDLRQDPALTLDDLARRQGVSPRYVQMLFEATGTTFSGFVLDLRLEAARHMLASPRYADWSITAIALEAGFGDLSYFNRRFRQRYQGTPTAIRAEGSRQA
jgi:AraC-like DNA-binding protein